MGQRNAQKLSLHDVAVRRAIAAAVPYDTILHDVEHNITIPVRNTLPATALGYESLPRRTYDLATANMFLDRAGWRRGADGIRLRNGVRLNLTLAAIAGATSGEQVALLLQSSLKSVGVDLAIKSYALTEYYALSGPLYAGSFDLALTNSGVIWDPDLYDSLGLRSLVPSRRKYRPVLRSPRRRARTRRAANRRPVAKGRHLSQGKSFDLVGRALRSFVWWAQPDRPLGRLAKLSAHADRRLESVAIGYLAEP